MKARSARLADTVTVTVTEAVFLSLKLMVTVLLKSYLFLKVIVMLCVWGQPII